MKGDNMKKDKTYALKKNDIAYIIWYTLGGLNLRHRGDEELGATYLKIDTEYAEKLADFLIEVNDWEL